MSSPVAIAQLVTPPSSPTSTPKAPGAPKKPRNRSQSELSPPRGLLERRSLGGVVVPHFRLGDPVDDVLEEAIGSMAVSSEKQVAAGVPTGQGLYDRDADLCKCCEMYAVLNTDDGTVVLAMDFHGQTNVVSIGTMSNMEIARKVANLLVEDHHAANGDAPACEFLTDPSRHSTCHSTRNVTDFGGEDP